MRTFLTFALCAVAHGFVSPMVLNRAAGRSDAQMMLGFVAEKVGMTQIFNEEGNEAIPVTVLKVGKNVITQVKTEEKEGYNAIQVGYDESPERKLKKPQVTELTKADLPMMRRRTEFVLDSCDDYSVGSDVGMDIFEEGERVAVSGVSVGKGFQGTVKRHHFTRGPMTHGSKNHRAPGSIGMGTDPGRILPGKKMAGQMGNKKVTVKGLQIVKIMEDDGLMLVRGSVPGKPGAKLEVTKSKW